MKRSRKYFSRLILILATIALMSCKKETAREIVTERPPTPVKTTPAKIITFVNKLTIQGTLEAEFYANVAAKIDGVLEEIWVDEGDAVESNKTKLFMIDNRKQEQNEIVSRQAALVAAQNHKVALANIDRAKAAAKKAKLDMDRFTRLREQGAATANELELHQTNCEQAEATLNLAMAQAEAAKEQVAQAEAAYQIAKKDLEDCTILAPLTGTVVARMKEPGEQASKSAPVIKIKNLDKLEATAFVPGNYYDNIQVGKTKIALAANGTDAGTYVVTHKAPTIDTTLRTFEIKAKLDKVPGNTTLAPGMLVGISIVLDTRDGLAVPSHSVIQRAQGHLIFIEKDNIARQLLVNIGYEQDGFTEITPKPEQNLPLQPGDQVVAEGQYLVKDGDKIQR